MTLSKRGPSTLKASVAIARVTFHEILRDKLLYNVLLCCFLLFGVGFLASKLTFIHPERVILDFGLSAVHLSCAVIAVFTGSSLLAREFDRRTIYVALCHPISRAQFLFGKFLGLALILALNWLLLSASYLSILYFTEGGKELFVPILFAAIFLILIQSLVIASVALFFSAFTTTSLSVMFTIGFYLIGNTVSQLRLIASRLQSHLSGFLLNLFTLIVPDLEYFNFGLKVTYGLPVSARLVCYSTLYGLLVITLLLMVAGFLVQSREV